MPSLLELFVSVDDFWQAFGPYWYQHLLTSAKRRRIRAGQWSESEIMTLVILFLATGHQTEVRPEQNRDGIIECEPAF